MEEVPAPLVAQTPVQGYRVTKNQTNTVPPKKQKVPVTNPKEMEIHKLLDKELQKQSSLESSIK